MDNTTTFKMTKKLLVHTKNFPLFHQLTYLGDINFLHKRTCQFFVAVAIYQTTLYIKQDYLLKLNLKLAYKAIN